MSWNAQIIDEFRNNEGRVGGPFQGRTLLLLHSRGAKTGQERINPLAFRRDGDNFVIFGSKGGAPNHPDWYWNLKANPQAKIEVGTDSFDVKARITDGEERERLWTLQKTEWPGFADYEKKTTRQIPVIVLEPV